MSIALKLLTEISKTTLTLMKMIQILVPIQSWDDELLKEYQYSYQSKFKILLFKCCKDSFQQQSVKLIKKNTDFRV